MVIGYIISWMVTQRRHGWNIDGVMGYLLQIPSAIYPGVSEFMFNANREAYRAPQHQMYFKKA
jgi:hypothetical protein